MRRRDGSPLWIGPESRTGVTLSRTDLGATTTSSYNEAWLQELLLQHPQAIPIEQIEPGFGDLISVCRELPLSLGGGRQGALDNFYITSEGNIALVEAKLWRNPESRRSVIAQAMEYAAAVFKMNYTELETASQKAQKAMGLPVTSLYSVACSKAAHIDEAEFIDAVSRNLRSGRAVIAVVGDGIREDILPLASLLQSHAGHRFTFALVELGVFDGVGAGGKLIIPSVLAQTVLIERGVVRVDGAQDISISALASPTEARNGGVASGRRMTIGEDEFYEALAAKEPMMPNLLKMFLNEADKIGVYAERQSGLSLKHTAPEGQPLNMGTITRDGYVDTSPATWWGRKLQGQVYNERLASLIGGFVRETNNGDVSVVRTAAGKTPRLSDFLPQHQEAWLDAMGTYISAMLAKAD